MGTLTRVSKTENVKGLEGKKLKSMNIGGGNFFCLDSLGKIK